MHIVREVFEKSVKEKFPIKCVEAAKNVQNVRKELLILLSRQRDLLIMDPNPFSWDVRDQVRYWMGKEVQTKEVGDDTDFDLEQHLWHLVETGLKPFVRESDQIVAEEDRAYARRESEQIAEDERVCMKGSPSSSFHPHKEEDVVEADLDAERDTDGIASWTRSHSHSGSHSGKDVPDIAIPLLRDASDDTILEVELTMVVPLQGPYVPPANPDITNMSSDILRGVQFETITEHTLRPDEWTAVSVVVD